MIRRMLALLILAAFMVVMAALPALAAPPPNAGQGQQIAQCAIQNAPDPGVVGACVNPVPGPPAP